MSSILVLGGAGYIGSHTVYELIAVGENVVVVDNLETGFRKAVHQDAKKVNTTGDLYPEEMKELKEMVKELWRILRSSQLK